jgi:hypothetical protein
VRALLTFALTTAVGYAFYAVLMSHWGPAMAPGRFPEPMDWGKMGARSVRAFYFRQGSEYAPLGMLSGVVSCLFVRWWWASPLALLSGVAVRAIGWLGRGLYYTSVFGEAWPSVVTVEIAGLALGVLMGVALVALGQTIGRVISASPSAETGFWVEQSGSTDSDAIPPEGSREG